MDAILPSFLNDGITWPEAIVTLGLLAFAGFCLIALAALLITLFSE